MPLLSQQHSEDQEGQFHVDPSKSRKVQIRPHFLVSYDTLRDLHTETVYFQRRHYRTLHRYEHPESCRGRLLALEVDRVHNEGHFQVHEIHTHKTKGR